MSLNPNLLINLLPTVISAGQNAAQQLTESYKQQVEQYMQGKKQFEDLVMQDLQKKREADRKKFETIKQSRDDRKSEKQKSIGEAWATALGMDSLSGSEE